MDMKYLKFFLIPRSLIKYIHFWNWSCVQTDFQMFLFPLKHNMLLGSFSNHARKHDLQVLHKLVEFAARLLVSLKQKENKQNTERLFNYKNAKQSFLLMLSNLWIKMHAKHFLYMMNDSDTSKQARNRYW